MSLIVLSKDLMLLGAISRYSSFSLTRHYSKAGEFELTLKNTDHMDLLKKDNILMLGKDVKKVGIISYANVKLNDDGSEVVTVKGSTLGKKLSDRLTEPNGETDRIHANAETVMRYYVNRNMINPEDSKRKFDDLLISTEDKKRGKEIKYETRYKNLLEEIETISEQNEIGWEVYIDYEKQKWVFNVYEGLDLTIDQEINPPVLFSTSLGNVDSQEYTEHNLDYKNVAYVGGKGEGQAREIIQVGDATGFDRKEVFLEPRVSDDEYIDLRMLGQNELSNYKELVSFQAEVLSNKLLQYEKDYNLGDLVTIKSEKWGIQVNTRIISINEVHEPTGFKVFVSFGNKIPTLVDKLKQQFNSMDSLRRK